MNRTSPVMAENHEGEEELKRDGRHHEEVYGDQVLGVIVEKGSPLLGGRFAVPDHVFGDRGLRHLDTKFQEFAMNARSSPAGVGEAHFPDQFANLELPLGDLCNADSSISNRGETPCDARR